MLAVACVFLAPLLVLLLVYIVYPIIDSFYISLFQWNGISSDRKFIGLNNWLDSNPHRPCDGYIFGVWRKKAECIQGGVVHPAPDVLGGDRVLVCLCSCH